MELQEMLSQQDPMLVDTSFLDHHKGGREGVISLLRQAKKLRDVPKRRLEEETAFLNYFHNIMDMEDQSLPSGVNQDSQFFTIPEVVCEIEGHITSLVFYERSLFSRLSKMGNRSGAYLRETENHLGVFSLIAQYKKALLAVKESLAKRDIMACFDSEDLETFDAYDSWIEGRTLSWKRPLSITDRRLIAAGLTSAYGGDTLIISRDGGIAHVVHNISQYRKTHRHTGMPFPSNILSVLSNLGEEWRITVDSHKGYHPNPAYTKPQLTA